MAESLAVASTIIRFISASARLSDSLLLLKQKNDQAERIRLEVSLSLHKIKIWQENWSGQVDALNLSAETLWGAQGWAKINELLQKIKQQSESIQRLLTEIQGSQKAQPRLRWKRAIERISNRKTVDQHRELRDQAAVLNKTVDELWIYSDTVFDSLHGLLASKSKLEGGNTLLLSALRSRAGSLKLYELCLSQKEDYNLELDLDGNGTVSEFLHDQDSKSLAVSYPLVTEIGEKELQKVVVKDVEERDISKDEMNSIIETDALDLQLFRPRSRPRIIKVPHHRIGSQHYLRIPWEPPEIVRLKSDPRSLARLLKNRQASAKDLTSLASPSKENLDAGAKIKLAFKIIECGFFLLGTPWFSSLNSKNLRRCNDAEEKSSVFMLRTQTLELKDLISDDPGALAETAQLNRLGVLLMEIALETPEMGPRVAEPELDSDRISKLPQVERAMGVQYCMATAFCLQCRKSRFAGPEKYEGKGFAGWEAYLETFLAEYYSQVFLR